MKPCALPLVLAATLVVAGCATAERSAAIPDDEKVYVTGSRIPVREGGGINTKAITDRNSIDQMTGNKGGNATGGVLGASGS